MTKVTPLPFAPYPVSRSSSPSSLRWIWWWTVAHLAEAAVALRSRVMGQSAAAPTLREAQASAPDRSAHPSVGWAALALASLAAYGMGILLGLVLRSHVI